MQKTRICTNLWDIPVNRVDIDQSLLNIENKTRSNLFPWKGQFSPQLIESLIQTYVMPGHTLLDPFVGSGTVLLEAGRQGLQAYGCEINPAAYIMSRTYSLINISKRKRIELLNNFEISLKAKLCEDTDKFQLLEDYVIRTLISFRASLHDRMSLDIFETLIIMLDFYNSDFRVTRILEVWFKLKTIIVNLPFSYLPIRAYNCDARTIPLSDNSVDCVITSPPYINVFNYHQQYRSSAESLGWNLLSVAKSEIGANRKNRGNRFLTVIEYCLEIAQVLSELRRVIKDNSRIIFIVGRESKVRGISIKNGEIVSSLGQNCAGFRLVDRQERVFKNRFGSMIYEDILHFKNISNKEEINELEEARILARKVLYESYDTAQNDVKEDIQNALDRIANLSPSALFMPLQSLTLKSKINKGGAKHDLSDSAFREAKCTASER